MRHSTCFHHLLVSHLVDLCTAGVGMLVSFVPLYPAFTRNLTSSRCGASTGKARLLAIVELACFEDHSCRTIAVLKSTTTVTSKEDASPVAVVVLNEDIHLLAILKPKALWIAAAASERGTSDLVAFGMAVVTPTSDDTQRHSHTPTNVPELKSSMGTRLEGLHQQSRTALAETVSALTRSQEFSQSVERSGPEFSQRGINAAAGVKRSKAAVAAIATVWTKRTVGSIVRGYST